MPELSPDSLKLLVDLARRALRAHLSGQPVPTVATADIPAELHITTGVFVALRRCKHLRGCVGSIEPRRLLPAEVIEMAVSAASEDSRFPPLTLDELDDLEIDVSVLTPMVRVSGPQEIIPRRHGVLVKNGWKRGLFLPQVWEETGWDREEFLDALCTQKAGLSPQAIADPQTEWFVFEVRGVCGRAERSGSESERAGSETERAGTGTGPYDADEDA